MKKNIGKLTDTNNLHRFQIDELEKESVDKTVNFLLKKNLLDPTIQKNYRIFILIEESLRRKRTGKDAFLKSKKIFPIKNQIKKNLKVSHDGIINLSETFDADIGVSIYDVKISSNPLNVPIVFIDEVIRGLDSPGWTDGNIIYLNKKIITELAEKSRIEDLTAFVQAIIFHETGHVLLTDFQSYIPFISLVSSYYPYIWKLIVDLANILEDERIEFYLSVLYPGLVTKFRTASIILSQLPISEDKGIIGALHSINRFIFAMVRMKRLKGSIKEYIEKYFPENKEFLEQLFDAKGLKVLVEAIHASNTRATLIRSLYFYKRGLEILTKMYGENTVNNELKNYSRYNYNLIYLILKNNTPLGNIAPFLSDDILAEIYQLYEKGLADWGHISKLLADKGIKAVHATKGGFNQIVEYRDYMFYTNVINTNMEKILRLRKDFEELKRDWDLDKQDWGDPLEEHMLEAYEWSLTRDIPRPRIFEGYRKVEPLLDILILLDQSGSMDGVPGELVMTAAVIIAEAVRPLLSRNIRLGIYTFGDNIRKIKGFDESLNEGRFFPKPFGGTAAFESLLRVVESEKDNFNKDATKLFLVFSDSFNYDNDMAVANLRKIHKMIGFDIRTIALMTARSYDVDFAEKFDAAFVITHIDELSDAMSKILYQEILNQSLQARI